MGIPKVKSASDLRADLYESLKEVSKGKTLLVTHKSGESILLSKEHYDDLLEEIETDKDIIAGLQDLIEGRVFSHKEVLNRMKELRKKWQK